MSTDNNNFTIKDTSSEFVKILPNKWIEPPIIARVRVSMELMNTF